MGQDVKTYVIPFSRLEKTAYEYCKQENHISEDTPIKRREKFEKQAIKVWDEIKNAQVRAELMFVEDGVDREALFPKDWLKKYLKMRKQSFRVCLYWLSIVQEFPKEEKFSLQFLQDTWCSAVLLAVKDKVEQYLLKDRWKAKQVKSVAPGIDLLPLDCVEEWAKICMQAGMDIIVDSDGHMFPENSLFAAYIEVI